MCINKQRNKRQCVKEAAFVNVEKRDEQQDEASVLWQPVPLGLREIEVMSQRSELADLNVCLLFKV